MMAILINENTRVLIQGITGNVGAFQTRIMKNYGTQVQYSVFECRINAVQMLLLRHQVKRLINPDEDSVRIYRVCKSCQPKVERIGGDRPLEGHTVVV